MLQWIELENGAHARTVGQESRQRGLEEQTEIQSMVAGREKISLQLGCLSIESYSLHSLVVQRIASGFTDDQIGPLHDHNRNEERRVTSEL